jgi:hypothetical protein
MSSKLLRAALRSTKGRIVLAVLLCAIAWQLWLSIAAPHKLAPALMQAGADKVNILVTLPFPPERFHVIAFQRYGRVSGTQDNAIEVRGVNKADLLSVARPYWVVKVDPLPTEGAIP